MLNLNGLHDDLVAAINQMYLMDEKFPHSNYRVQLVNRLGEYIKIIRRKQAVPQTISARIAKPEPYLPWDE